MASVLTLMPGQVGVAPTVKLRGRPTQFDAHGPKKVAQTKDLHELIDLQTRYGQSQMKWYADQTQEFGRLMARALSDMKKTPSRE
jgi:hypothetical protein